MKNKKSLLSVLLAAVLLCACVAGMLIFSASAEGEAIYAETYTVDSDNGITAAMSEIAAAVEAGTITEGPVLIDVVANISDAPDGEGYLFSKDTIAIGGEALDITIRGNGNAITINTSEALTTTNDFTFENISFTTDAPKLNLGCRNVVFDNFGISGTSAAPRTILLNNGNVDKNSSLTVKSGTYTYCYFSLIDGGYTVAENVKTVLNWEGGTLSALDKETNNPDKNSVISGCNNQPLYSSTVTDTTCETINGEIEINVTGGSIASAILLSGNTTVNGVATIKMSGGTMNGNFIGSCGSYGGTPVLNGRLNVDVSNVKLSNTFRTAMTDFKANSGSKIFTKIYNCSATNATFLFINGTMKLYGDVEYDIGKFTCTATTLSLVSSNRTNSTQRKAILGGNYKFTFRSGNKISSIVHPMKSSKTASYPLVANCNMEVIFLDGTYSGAVCDISNVTFTGSRKIDIQGGTFGSTVTGGDVTITGGTFKGVVDGDSVALNGNVSILEGGQINADTVGANVTVTKNDAWGTFDTVYVTAPADAAQKITVVNGDGVTGLPVIMNKGYQLRGMIDAQAKLFVDTRTMLRLYFNKAQIEQYLAVEESITCLVNMENVGDLATGTLDLNDFEAIGETDYCYIDLDAVGAGSFGNDITVSFNSIPVQGTTILQICQNGIGVYTGVDGDLFKALYDYGLTAINKDATLQYDGIEIDENDVESLTGKFSKPETTPVSFNGITLLMGDAIGIRFKFTPDASLDKNLFKVIIAGEDLVQQGKCVIDVAAGTLDFFVNAESLAKGLTVEISYGEGENAALCMSMNGVSVKSIAMALSSANARVKATQNFIQATQNYLAAQAA